MATSRWTRSLWVGIVVGVAASLPTGSVLAAAPQEKGPPLSRGDHPSPPAGEALERLVALNDHEPTIEGAGDISALVVTHAVYVKIAADEEWRSYYGTNSFYIAENSIETADDAMFNEFGVNLIKHQTANWTSNPGGAQNACDLLADLAADLSPGTSDILIGYAKNYSSNYAGCAEINGDEAEVNWNLSSYNRWVTTQHEVSHLYSLPDRYPDPFNRHPLDVMENQYDKPDFWCALNAAYNDHGIFSDHAHKFD